METVIDWICQRAGLEPEQIADFKIEKTQVTVSLVPTPVPLRTHGMLTTCAECDVRLKHREVDALDVHKPSCAWRRAHEPVVIPLGAGDTFPG
jgi:hypothetical protein